MNKKDTTIIIKPFVFLFIFVSSCIQLWGQENINAGGADVSNQEIQLSYTLGGTFYESFSGSSCEVVPGIQIPYEYNMVTGIDNPDINLSIGLYPNPVVDLLKIHFPEFEKSSYTFYLQDISGKVVVIEKIKNELTEVDFQSFPSGLYILSIKEKGTVMKTFKIIKK